MTLTAAGITPKVTSVRTFSAGQRLAEVPGTPQAVVLAGHTPGSTAYLFADRGLLFTGDALVTYDSLTGHKGPALVCRGFRKGIAARAGVAKQSVYKWWPDKSAVIAETLAELGQALVPIPDEGSLEEDLAAFLADTFREARSPAVAPVLRGLMAEAQGSQAGLDALATFGDRRGTHFPRHPRTVGAARRAATGRRSGPAGRRGLRVPLVPAAATACRTRPARGWSARRIDHP